MGTNKEYSQKTTHTGRQEESEEKEEEEEEKSMFSQQKNILE